ncbi:hypothetical protein DL546_008060 [Coniochaeta pulveracea]|uniref:Uncharacterized protein n=1 Tax=Coniochaeta pulveracea TaxID=177199 RepID=A0A420YH57_9PEZI|nr:hypothetical protein DL546_008060 [Coniochaeta pulveracea]
MRAALRPGNATLTNISNQRHAAVAFLTEQPRKIALVIPAALRNLVVRTFPAVTHCRSCLTVWVALQQIAKFEASGPTIV